MNALNESVLFEDFYMSKNQNGFAIIPCSFHKELNIECIVHDRRGRVRKSLNFAVNQDTVSLEIDTKGIAEDYLEVWFYVEKQTYLREIRLSNIEDEKKLGSIGRFFNFFK
ncbi:MAG: hypothetical protein IPN76_32825 [Saprospiraceae bacterium]|nr:hypothetical protein [Saprospiraceae bacterium]